MLMCIMRYIEQEDMMGKTICIFSTFYIPHLGGVERYTYNLSKKLVEYGNRVVVVTANVDGISNQDKIEGIEIIRMPCYNVLNGRFPVLKYNNEHKELVRILSQMQFDFVVNSRFYSISYFGACFAKKQGLKSIVIEHGTNHFSINNRLLTFFGHIYEHLITALIKKYCKEYYGVSLACMKWLEHFGIEARAPLYNAVDINNIKHILNNPIEDYRKKFGIQEDDIIIAYTGRLVVEKGILKLIDAVKQLNNSGKKVYLLIAGEGDLYQDICNNTTDTILALGKLDFPYVIALLKQSDIFCLPTDYPEGFPTSVLEAVACKCFVVTTSSGGSKELISDRDYGIILNENTVEEIYRNLVNAIEDELYRINATEKAYQRLIENFTWDIVAKNLMNLIMED